MDFHDPLILNNADWYKDINVIDFFSNVGSCFRLSSMLGKESVQQRLASSEGMSFQEFSYQVFQAYDFLHLHRHHNCILQIGGGDQWGNITAGCEFVRKAANSEVHGLTVPLMTTSTGEKIGKSAGNAVWLSPNKTSCYQLYQYFVKVSDSDVEKYLKALTFLPLEEVKSVMEEHRQTPEDRVAQKRLAECVTRTVHGEQGLCQAVNATSALFGSPGALKQLKKSELEQLLADAPTFETPLRDVDEDLTVVAVLNRAGILESKGQGKRLVEGGGLYVNHEKVTTPSEVFSKESHIIHDNLTVVRIGKSNYFILKWV
jgi:tyrosyl-tRNA synthetase